MAKEDLEFLDSREWGREVNALQRDGMTYAGAVEYLNKKGVYKDIREKEDFDKGVKPEEKYPELSKKKKSE